MIAMSPRLAATASTTGTATIDGNRVYQLAREGDLVCLELESGKVAWQRNLAKDLEYSKPDWGFSGAPLVWDDASTYASDQPIDSPLQWEWNHGIGEIVTAVLSAGLELTALVEHDSVPWEALPGLMTLDEATGEYLRNNRGPARKVGELDNRGSHFYLAMYWAQALARQADDRELASHFAPIAAELSSNEARIVGELNGVQGRTVDIGGYYHPDERKAGEAMRPSATLNAIIGQGATVSV